MVIRLLKSVLVLCCCYEQAPLLPIEAAVTASKNDLASEPRSVPELIEYWGYPGETHWIKTADDYVLAVHRISGGGHGEAAAEPEAEVPGAGPGDGPAPGAEPVPGDAMPPA